MWEIEHNEATGANELTDGRDSYSLAPEEELHLKDGTKAEMLAAIKKRAGANATVTDDELNSIRSALGGSALQSAKRVHRVGLNEGEDA